MRKFSPSIWVLGMGIVMFSGFILGGKSNGENWGMGSTVGYLISGWCAGRGERLYMTAAILLMVTVYNLEFLSCLIGFILGAIAYHYTDWTEEPI